jgi:uncharacterized protein (DUF2267 family)
MKLVTTKKAKKPLKVLKIQEREIIKEKIRSIKDKLSKEQKRIFKDVLNG